MLRNTLSASAARRIVGPAMTGGSLGRLSTPTSSANAPPITAAPANPSALRFQRRERWPRSCARTSSASTACGALASTAAVSVRLSRVSFDGRSGRTLRGFVASPPVPAPSRVRRGASLASASPPAPSAPTGLEARGMPSRPASAQAPSFPPAPFRPRLLRREPFRSSWTPRQVASGGWRDDAVQTVGANIGIVFPEVGDALTSSRRSQWRS